MKCNFSVCVCHCFEINFSSFIAERVERIEPKEWQFRVSGILHTIIATFDSRCIHEVMEYTSR